MADQVKEHEIKFFDKYNREGGYDRFAEESYDLMISLIKKNVNPKPGQTLVDMGCGTGAFAKRVADAIPGVRVLGVDISAGCINRATQMYPGLKFQTGDIETTGLPANSIDIICYFGVLHHFPDFQKVAAEARRILKPGGTFFSFDPNHHNPPFWLYRAHESPFYSPVGVTENERLVTKREVKEVFERNGFDVYVRVISGIKFVYAESAMVRRVLGLYNLFDKILSYSPLENTIGAWVVGWGQKKS